jgi:hypothetical protein
MEIASISGESTDQGVLNQGTGERGGLSLGKGDFYRRDRRERRGGKLKMHFSAFSALSAVKMHFANDRSGSLERRLASL